MSEPSIVERRVVERRRAQRTRRIALEDRRNSERVAEDIAPRRNPETSDRRKR